MPCQAVHKLIMHCAIYIRKSREDKDKPSQRLQVQREQLPAHAKSMGWFCSIYDDGHASAAQGKTESLKERARLETDIRAGKINIILTIELSRLSRDDTLQDFTYWLDLCVRHNVKLATMSRILDPAQHSDWMLLIMEGSFSGLEMKRIKERMEDGWQQAWRTGKWLGGTPPPPYRYDLANSRPVIDPEQLPKMRKLWQLAETMSARAIAENMNLPEIFVRRAISDERLLVYQALRTDNTTAEPLLCDWEACMDAAQAIRVRDGRRTRKNVNGPRAAYASLLSAMGVFYCGYCGATAKTWQGNQSRTGGIRTDYYGCQKKNGRTCQRSRMIKQNIFDRLLVENLINTLANIEHLKHCWMIYQGGADPEKELAALIKQERSEESKKKRLIAAISEGVLGFAEAKATIAEINGNIQAIKESRDKLIDRQSAHFDFDAISITRKEFDQMDTSSQRDIIKAAIARIDMHSSYAVVTYRFPRTPESDCTSRINLPPAEKPKKH